MKQLFAILVCCTFITGCATTGKEDLKSRVKFTQRGNDVLVTVDSDILFDYNSATLRKGSSEVLDILVSDSLSRTRKNLLVEGHTDIRGSESGNIILSDERATTVKNALIARGIHSSRVKSIGHGSKQLEVANASNEDEHQRNRRAVIVIPNEKVEVVRTSSFEDTFKNLLKNIGLK